MKLKKTILTFFVEIIQNLFINSKILNKKGSFIVIDKKWALKPDCITIYTLKIYQKSAERWNKLK